MADDTSVVPGVSEDSGSVVLQDPYGKLVTVDSAEAPRAIQQGGYQQASPEAIAAKDEEAKYTSPIEKGKAYLEGLGTPYTLGALPLAERALGADPEDIRKRAEYNPYTRGLGMGTAFAIPVLGELAGAGEAVGLGATAIQAAGKAVPRALGLGGAEAGLASRIGSSAVQNAIEGGLIGATDEVSKLASGEPAPRVDTALTNIGLQGLFGGVLGAGFGTVHPIWKATSGSKLGQTLSAITSKLNGELPINPAARAAEEAAGVELAPELRAATSDSPIARDAASTLQDSHTWTAENFKKTIGEAHDKIANGIVESIGKTPEEIKDLPSSFSHAEAGQKIGETLAKEFRAQAEPKLEVWNQIGEDLKNAKLSQEDVGSLQQSFQDIAAERRLNESPSSPESKFINRLIQEAPLKTDLQSLKTLASQIGNETGFGSGLQGLGTPVRRAIRELESNIIEREGAQIRPDLVGQLKQARADYAAIKDLQESIRERLPLGKEGKASPGVFFDSLESLAKEDPEAFARRLTGKGDASWLKLVQEKFPETAKAIRDFQVNQLLKNAAAKALPNETLRPSFFFKDLEKMSPELRQFSFSPEQLQQYKGMQDLLDRIPNRTNFSDTAPTLVDKVLRGLPETAGAAAALLLHSNPLIGAGIGFLAKLTARDIPDAARLALLKFLGRSEPIDAAGFKTMVDFFHHMIKGEQTMNRVVKDVFKGTALSFPIKNSLTDNQRKKIEKQVDQFSQQPEKLLNIGGSAGHYMPGEQTALTKTAGNVVQALSMLKPKATVHNIFAGDIPGPKADQQRYEHAMDLANQPLLIMKSLKDNKLTVEEMQFMGALYPALLQRLRGKVMNELVDHISKGGKVPYAQRLNLSLFLGQPLDPSMSPEAIQQSQAVLMAPAQAMSTQSQTPHAQGPHSMKAMSKLPSLYGTPQQAREASHLKDR